MSNSDTDVEIDEAQVIRPERFILPEVSGMAVPLRLDRDGKEFSDWRLLLRWKDGRREQIVFDEAMAIGGRKVYLKPRPGAPQSSQIGQWSRASREAWLRSDASLPPEAICERLLAGFAKYLDLPQDAAAGVVATLTCWTVLTYIYPVFNAVPYLAVTGALGCGKTRILDLLEQLAFRPFVTSNLSNSVLFRHLDMFGGTLLLDEGEQFGENRTPESSEILTSLLAGYKRGKMISRSEPVGDGDFRPRHYCVSGPKVIACINEPAPTLASRSIPIRMTRAPASSAKPRLRIEQDSGEWAILRDGLHAMAMDHGPDWTTLPDRQHVCPEMSGRNYEVWQPLLAIAEWLDHRGAGGLYRVLREHAIRTIESSSEAAMPEEDGVLLQAVARLAAGGGKGTAKELLQQVASEEPGLFKGWSAKRVATCLRRYGLSSRKTRGNLVFDPSPDDLLRIQRNYQIDLGIADTTVGDSQQFPLDGVRGVHGVRVPEEPSNAV